MYILDHRYCRYCKIIVDDIKALRTKNIPKSNISNNIFSKIYSVISSQEKKSFKKMLSSLLSNNLITFHPQYKPVKEDSTAGGRKWRTATWPG